MKQPIAVLITDTHLTNKNQEQIVSIFEQCFQFALDWGVDKVFHLGDIFTSRSSQELAVLLCFQDILNRAEELGITIIAIAGNHDKTDLDSPNSYLDVFEYNPSFTVIREEKVLKIGGLNCCFLPYFLESGSYPDRIKKLAKAAGKTAENNVLFTHIAFDGVSNNDGTTVKGHIPQNLIKRFKRTYVGHYHNRQSLHGGRVRYIGSSHPQNFGEDNMKGFSMLFDDTSVKFQKADFPEYHTVVIDTDSHYDLAALTNETQTVRIGGDFVKIKLTGTDETIAVFDETELKQMGVVVEKEPKTVTKNMEAAETGKVINFNNKTIFKSYLQFCSQNGFTSEQRKFGQKYIKK